MSVVSIFLMSFIFIVSFAAPALFMPANIAIDPNNNITINVIPIEQINSLDEFACYENYLINRPIE